MVSNIKDKLLGLKAITATTGAISELQVHQIKYWVPLFFHDFTWEVNLDVEQKTVKLLISKPKSIISQVLQAFKNDHLAESIANLSTSIKWLLGDNWGVDVFLNDLLVYTDNRSDFNITKPRDV